MTLEIRSPSTLQTHRLRLRKLIHHDAPFILRLLNEPSFLEHIGDKGVRSLEDARRYLEGGPMASYIAHGHGLMAVVLDTTGEPIGMCGLLKREHLEHPDLGYAFLPRFWGQGYALEAAQAVLADGLNRLGLTTFLALVSPGNGASIRLLEKVGFSFEKREAFSPDEPEVAMYARRDGSGRGGTLLA